MNKNRTLAVGVLWGIVVLGIPLWFLSYPETTFRNPAKPLLLYAGQLVGILGFSLYALSLMLSTRMQWIEDIFGGLDKLYHTHHTFGKAAFGFLVAHPLMLSLRWVPEDIEKALWYMLPFHHRTEINLGSWAFWGLVLLMLFTLVNKIPYDKWKITHKFMGIFFILGILHIFFLDGLVMQNLPLTIYLAFLSVLGVLSYLYKSLFFNWVNRKYTYIVIEVDRLNSQIMQVSLEPSGTQVPFVPGQFCFFSFRDVSLSREAHPYTICSTPNQDTITVKALGDYTYQLYRELRSGVPALLEGPYGRFDYSEHSYPQIWIAGGVGIAPFISWAEALDSLEVPTGFRVDLYYCVNVQADAVHNDLFNRLEQHLPGFSFHLSCADIQGFLKARDIPGVQHKNIFICGPKEMRQALLKEFRELQIPNKNIFFEDFDFF